MPKKAQRLGDAELEIMQVIWQSESPLTSTEISKSLPYRKWALSTLMTSLARMERKGYVACDRTTRTNMYTALVSEKNYLTEMSEYFIKKLYGNSVIDFIKNMHDNKFVSKDDLSELRSYLDTIDTKEKRIG
jgi:predicted transcriptional regulator